MAARGRAAQARAAAVRAEAREANIDRLVEVSRIRQLDLLEGRPTSRADHGLDTVIPKIIAVIQRAHADLPDALRESITSAVASGFRELADGDVLDGGSPTPRRRGRS